MLLYFGIVATDDGDWGGGIIPREKDTDFFAQITFCTKLGIVLFKMHTKVKNNLNNQYYIMNHSSACHY
jgi:hypothetical protein